MNVEFHPEAELELHETALHYDIRMSGLGRQFGAEVSRVIQLLLENPELGSRVDNHLRHFVLRRFPFSVIYAVTPAVLYVVAVAHGSREPGFWQLRVQER
jgi:plasmid stabilization system protein ParE